MYQADQIQSMINELDRVLRRTGRWRLWNLFTQLYDQRQMLERVRDFLLMQQRSDHRATPESSPIAPQALMRPLPPPHLHPDSVKLEVAALIAQRDALREEVKFLSALTQTPAPTLASTPAPALAPDPRQIEQLSALHDRTDFLLSSMDSSLQLAFTSMQKNVEVYQTTLHQGLDRMHNLGYQGEVLLSALINHLAQQMGRELAANPVNAVNPANAVNSANTLTAFPDDLRSVDHRAQPQDAPPIAPLQSPRPTEARSNPQTPMDPATPKQARSTPETKPSAEPRPETAVRFSPETALGDREMTLDTLFGSPFGEPSNDILGESFEVNNDRTDDITLEEMNALFADIPSLKA